MTEGPPEAVAMLPKTLHGKSVLTPLCFLHTGKFPVGVVQEKIDNREVRVEREWRKLVLVELDGGDLVPAIQKLLGHRVQRKNVAAGVERVENENR